MCRNITPLRGLEPPATAKEIEDAARQYLRKISALTTAGGMAHPAFELALAKVKAASTELLEQLPPRRQPPPVLPPLRRRAMTIGHARTPGD